MIRFLGLWLVCLAALAAVDVPKWGMFETAMTNNTSYGNKFRDVILEATFTSPSGREVPFWGFFDGDGTGGPDQIGRVNFNALNPPQDLAGELTGTVWKLRFMPDEIGTWTYTWSFDDGSKSGSGSFRCTQSTKRGVLKVNAQNPRWLEDGEGRAFYPKQHYIIPGEALTYPIDLYGPEVYDLYTDLGANMQVFPWLPIWTWNTHQTTPDNGPNDRSILIWYQQSAIPAHGDGSPDAANWDTDRMNLFTWKRIDSHIGYLADRGIYSWGFQGFHIKRTFPIQPKNFSAAKYEWYIRYCMARLAPRYNVLWNNTWESGSMNSVFKDLLDNHGFDPWDHLYFQVGSNHTIYDIAAGDGKSGTIPQGTVTRPVWKTESNGLWWASFDWDEAWKHATNGGTGVWTERTPRGFDNAVDWDTLGGLPAERMMAPWNFIGDETNFESLIPRDDLANGTDYILSDGVSQYVLYKSGGGTFSVSLALGTYDVLWFNPETLERRTDPDLTVTTLDAKSFTTQNGFTVLYLSQPAPGDTTPPSAPTGVQAVASPGRIDISWNAATDLETGISAYQIFVGDTLIGTTTGLSFSHSDGLIPDKVYTYRIRARNGAGLYGNLSDGATARALADNIAPTVSITAPSNGATFGIGSNITLSANATDTDGTVTSVRFYLIHQRGGDDVVLDQTDTDGTDGWSVVFTNAPADGYDLVAYATDNNGSSGESNTITFTVSDNQAPTITSLTVAPNPVTGTTATLTAVASDPDMDPLTYVWTTITAPDGGTAQIGNGASPTVTFTKAGAYVIELTVSDDHNGSDIESINVSVTPTPSSITVSP